MNFEKIRKRMFAILQDLLVCHLRHGTFSIKIARDFSQKLSLNSWFFRLLAKSIYISFLCLCMKINKMNFKEKGVGKN